MRTSNACPSPHLAARTSVASSSWPAMFCRSASASWRDAEFCIFVSNSCVRANCAGIVMMSPFLSFREGDPFLGSFRDFHEPFLNELRHPRHRIRVDLDSGKHVFVSPVVNLRRRATQLKVHTAFHQVRDEVFVRIAGCHIPFGVVRL